MKLSTCIAETVIAVSISLPLADLIRRFRHSAGLSQEELAGRSGLSTRAISDIERGLRPTPRLDTIRMLAASLGINDDERAELLHAARPELSHRSGKRQSHRSDSLPAPTTPLIGRDQAVVELVSHLREGGSNLITLTGPGGVGKTRLALEVANRVAAAFPGGAIFVDLAPVRNPDLVASAIAQTLGIRETGDRPLQATLCDALAARPPLFLLLDNFEQVIDAAPLVRDMLAAAPALRILITSREALRVRGEFEFQTQPLELPTDQGPDGPELIAQNPSIALFVQSARSVSPEFTLTAANATVVSKICRRLDGLPLAIELAASRIRHFPPNVLLGHMDRRLPLLTGGARDLPARQQTIRDTIAWSYDLLNTDEQVLFRRVGVFVGGASLEGIEAVAVNDPEPEFHFLAVLSSLIDKHLIREREDAHGAPRFFMLELIREFALEKLHEHGDHEGARQAHSQHFLDLLRASGSTWATHLHGSPGQDIFRREFDNIRSAFDWFERQGDSESCARLVDAIWAHCYVDGYFRQAHSLGTRVLALADSQPHNDELRPALLSTLSTSASVLGDHEAAVSYGEQGVEAARRLAPESGVLPLALVALAIAWRDQRRFAEGMDYAEQALPVARIPGVDDYIEPHVLYHLGRLAYLQNDLEQAAEYLGASLEQIRNLGPTETALYTINTLAAVHVRLGNLAETASLLREGQLLLPPGGYTGFWFDTAVLVAERCELTGQAVRLLGYYSAAYAAIGVLEIPVDPWMQEIVQSMREALGEARFEAARTAGTMMTKDKAIELALDVLDRAEAESGSSANDS